MKIVAATWALLLIAIVPQTAHAVLLQIDAAASAVTHNNQSLTFCYVDASGAEICPPNEPQTFGLSGSIELQANPWGDPELGLQLLVLTGVGLESAAVDHGFVLGQLVGLLEDGMFAASDNGCWLPELPDGWIASITCLVDFTSTSAAGTWDGRKLVMTGQRTGPSDRTDFTITAVAASVPEPGTLVLSLPLLLVLLRRRTGPRG